MLWLRYRVKCVVGMQRLQYICAVDGISNFNSCSISSIYYRSADRPRPFAGSHSTLDRSANECGAAGGTAEGGTNERFTDLTASAQCAKRT